MSIGSADDLTEAQQWIVDCIVANGYAVSRDNPNRETDMAHRNTVTKLGLKSKPKRINGEVVRVLVVRNERVFSVYRDSAAKDMTEALQEDENKPVPSRGHTHRPQERLAFRARLLPDSARTAGPAEERRP
ncbi:hypothetical protein [Bifidobacterium breve]|uniref:hypothetical protein n=1 Tax=Bifidobacterium breve TaxID=1685 RepID=UPI00067FEF08|nr:hypothetical protein [Bifidobacterium breve]KND53294.1 phage primase [Bifidobacterium breve]